MGCHPPLGGGGVPDFGMLHPLASDYPSPPCWVEARQGKIALCVTADRLTRPDDLKSQQLKETA